MSMKNSKVIIFCACVLLFLPSSTFSASGELLNYDTTKFMSQSQLTFQGAVENVKYRLSEEGTPHTFVTYQITRVVRGRVEGTDPSKITLRFIGGPMGDGRYLIPPHVPRFNVGEKDVLFVSRNGESECPLVGCSAGRLRIHNDRVYTAAGQPVTAIEQGRILSAGKPAQALRVIRYPRPDFDKLYQRKEYRALLSQHAPDADSEALRRIYQEHVPKQISFKLTHDRDNVHDFTHGAPPSNVTSAPHGQLHVSNLLQTLSRNVELVTHQLAPAKSQHSERPFRANIGAPSSPRPPVLPGGNLNRIEVPVVLNPVLGPIN